MISLKYSSLIDVLPFAYYNIHMDESNIVDLIAMETVAPKRRIIRSAGAIYIALILLTIASISLGNLLYDRLSISRYITQPILYALFTVCGYIVYKRCFICFRYTLTNEELAIERIGNTEKTIAAIPLYNIMLIRKTSVERWLAGRTVHAALPPMQNAIRIQARMGEEDVCYIISPSDAFLSQLQIAWQKAMHLQTTKHESS